MVEILGLIGAIFLVVKVLQLRALLALPFPRYRLHWLPGEPPQELADLFAEFTGKTTAAGFAPARWLRAERCDGEAETMAIRGVQRAPDGCGLLWIAAPVNAAHPNRPAIYFAHRLSDGRTAISQPFDPYFALLQGDDLVARTAAEPEFQGQWQAHLAWVQTLGSAPVAIPDDQLLSDTEAFFERTRQRLIQQGQLRALGADLAVPSFPLALRALGAMRRLPKSVVDIRPVPAERLVHLALNQETVSHRAPPRDVQWMLFGVSVALFMALGALFWNLQLALAILLVVVIHELGHFLAMRAFGYRNVHLLALPLVGGVAMGHDVNPGASKRAWMSLMGPLPGIVIGWMLLAFCLAVGPSSPELLTLAMVFLFVNYLNVLPVPPLDGAHVVEALLPPHWARVQTVLLGVAAVLGALLAWYFEFYLLTVLALLQLPALPGNWRLHGIEREVAATPLPAGTPRPARLLHVLRLLERQFGPATQAGPRIQQGLQVLQRLDVRPMGVPARVLTATVYLALLAVPVLGLLTTVNFGSGDEQAEAWLARHEASRSLLEERARSLPSSALLADLASDDAGPVPGPADAEAIRAAEQRLGRSLPADLREWYAEANGLPALQILPLENVDYPPSGLADEWAPAPEPLQLWSETGGSVELAAATIDTWWYLGGDEAAALLYLPEAHLKLPAVKVVQLHVEGNRYYPDLRAFIETRWVDREQTRQWEATQRDALRQSLRSLEDTPLEALLDEWPKPRFLLGWMSPELAVPDGADETVLVAAEQRLGVELPAELRRLLAIHDGFPSLQLLPADQLARWNDVRSRIDSYLIDAPEAPLEAGHATQGEDAERAMGFALPLRGQAAIEHCVIVAGWIAGQADESIIRARLLWCPDARPASWVDVGRQRGYASLREWVLPQAAQLRAFAEPQ